MELFKLFGRIAIENDDANKSIDETTDKAGDSESKIGKAFSGIGTAAVEAGKVIAKGLAVGVAALSGLVTKALGAGGELEQNMGGSEAVFGAYADSMQSKAAEAYGSMGLSASDFLATANKMGALFQGAGFGIEESADISAQAMQRAADVASIMGIDVGDAMEAIAGAAKGNFTMMDNLGVAMNDTTLQAYALEKGITKSTSEMTNQEKIGLAMQLFLEKTSYAAGNYAKENDTLAGSLGTAKAAFSNFLSGAGDADQLADAFIKVGSVVSERIVEILPKLITGLITLITRLAPEIPKILQAVLPSLIQGVVDLIHGLIEAMPDIIAAFMEAIPMLIDAIVDIVGAIVDALPEITRQVTDMLPTIIPMLITAITDIVVMLCSSFSDIIQPIIDRLPDIIISIVNALMENTPALIEGIIQLVIGIVRAIPQIISALLEALPTVIMLIIKTLVENLPLLIEGIITIVWEILKAIWDILKSIGQFFVDAFKNAFAMLKELFGPAKEMFSNFWQSIKNVFANVGSWFKGIFQGAWDGIKNVFSKVGDFFTGIWDTIKGIFSKVGTAIADAVSGAFKKAVNWVLEKAIGIINGFISGINACIGIINKIPGIEISKINKLDVPEMEEGGVLEKGQVGLLEGKGAEAVVPLDQNKAWISAVAKDMNDAVGGNNKDIKELKEAFKGFVDALPEILVDAFATMKFDVNNREFARLVRAVN